MIKGRATAGSGKTPQFWRGSTERGRHDMSVERRADMT